MCNVLRDPCIAASVGPPVFSSTRGNGGCTCAANGVDQVFGGKWKGLGILGSRTAYLERTRLSKR